MSGPPFLLQVRLTTVNCGYHLASQRYIANNADVRLFGILVRDVPPYEDDLRVRVSTLVTDCPVVMSIELLAVYLPAGSIDMLSRKVIDARKGRGI